MSHPGFDEYIERRYGEAIPLIRQAAIGGDGSAMATLGQIYCFGNGVERSLEEAVAWFRRSAEAGDSGGQYLYGKALEDGDGVASDEREAFKWYLKALAQDNRLAPYRVVEMLSRNPELEGVCEDLGIQLNWGDPEDDE